LAGYTDTETYLQSGIVVLTLGSAGEKAGAESVTGIIRTEFGLDVPVAVRSASRCRTLTNLHAGDDLVHVVFLGSVPDPAAEVALIAADWKPDEVSVSGRQVFVRYMKSMHESRLQHATILRRLGVLGTARNWRTVVALRKLIDQRGVHPEWGGAPRGGERAPGAAPVVSRYSSIRPGRTQNPPRPTPPHPGG